MGDVLDRLLSGSGQTTDPMAQWSELLEVATGISRARLRPILAEASPPTIRPEISDAEFLGTFDFYTGRVLELTQADPLLDDTVVWRAVVTARAELTGEKPAVLDRDAAPAAVPSVPASTPSPEPDGAPIPPPQRHTEAGTQGSDAAEPDGSLGSSSGGPARRPRVMPALAVGVVALVLGWCLGAFGPVAGSGVRSAPTGRATEPPRIVATPQPYKTSGPITTAVVPPTGGKKPTTHVPRLRHDGTLYVDDRVKEGEFTPRDAARLLSRLVTEATAVAGTAAGRRSRKPPRFSTPTRGVEENPASRCPSGDRSYWEHKAETTMTAKRADEVVRWVFDHWYRLGFEPDLATEAHRLTAVVSLQSTHRDALAENYHSYDVSVGHAKGKLVISGSGPCLPMHS